MSDTVEKTRTGAILYDTAMLNQISDQLFNVRGWSDARPVTGNLRSSGRGQTTIVSDGKTEFVLRHYMRGGLIGRLVRDVYAWSGEENTRPFAEWRLLYKMQALGLPVPRPAAARYRRSGMFYSADLLTVRVPGIEPLSQRLKSGYGDTGFWQRLGASLNAFHRHGVCHADLNAYNVQIDSKDALCLLDFDRGTIRRPGAWQAGNLARLHRSLRKIRALDPAIHWTDKDWRDLLDGYFQASRSA
ncbi:MAG: 3-deoxy-D-manno-octulosonic acid kinase [Halioglobus sp.]|nr:3-deoxy-D-manno-octulosonic acid kinase [Halioglobus sp.]